METTQGYPSKAKNAFRGSNFKVKPVRDKKYLDYIRSLPCLICQTPAPSDPHHVFTGGMGTKCDDTKTVPLCHYHHNKWHDTAGKAGGLGKTALNNILDRLNACYSRIGKK